MMSSFKLLLILAPLLAAIGCHDNDMQGPPPQTILPQQVNVSSDLHNEIVFNPIVTDYKTGNLHAQIPVRCTTDLDITVDYRFSYFDDSRHLIDSPTGWQMKTLHSNELETIDGTASSSQARDFQLDLRLAK